MNEIILEICTCAAKAHPHVHLPTMQAEMRPYQPAVEPLMTTCITWVTCPKCGFAYDSMRPHVCTYAVGQP